MRRRQSSTLGDLITLLFMPLTAMLKQRRGHPEQIKQFYRSAEWKRARYDVISRSPRCRLCGRGAGDGAKLNVDHIKPLSKRWDGIHSQTNLFTSTDRPAGITHDAIVADVCQDHRSGIAAFGSQPAGLLVRKPFAIEMALGKIY